MRQSVELVEFWLGPRVIVARSGTSGAAAVAHFRLKRQHFPPRGHPVLRTARIANGLSSQSVAPVSSPVSRSAAVVGGRRVPVATLVRSVASLLALGLTSATLPATASAQGNPRWSATLLVLPNPSPFLADWERNPQTATLTILYTGQGAQSYHVEAFARSATRGEIGRVRSPDLAFPFGPASQSFNSADVVDWQTVSSNRAITDLAMRTGVLPEGNYQFCARVIADNGALQAEACDQVAITLPEPPQLVFPANRGDTIGPQPAFQWTPVLAPPEVDLNYHVRIVERQLQQTAQAALAANVPQYEGSVSGAPLLVYPLDALPLRAGKEYAWQVEVVDAQNRPLTREARKSEIWSFVAGD